MAMYYSDKFIFVKDGCVRAFGDRSVVTPEIMEDVYGVKSEIVQVNGRPMVVPFKSTFDGTEILERMGRWMKK